MSVPSVFPTCLRRASGSVFHYTSSAGLLGVIKDRSLWASEAGGLNDLAEVRQGWEFIRRWLDDQPADDAVSFLRDLADHPLNAPHEVFVLCASTDGDDANQWRLYANAGRGYVVELDPTEPLAIVSTNKATAATRSTIGILLRDTASTSP